MPFVKALIWVAVIIVAIIFSVNNWVPVTIALWGDLLLDTKLPVLIILAFMLGWLPLYLIHKAGKWRSKRVIQSLQEARPGIPDNMAVDMYAPDASSANTGPHTGPDMGPNDSASGESSDVAEGEKP